jgi:hypothetical protein
MHAIIQLVACEHLMRVAINGTQRHPAAMKAPEWQSIPIQRQSEIIRANYPGQSEIIRANYPGQSEIIRANYPGQ